MIWILATRGASWFNGMEETVIEGVHSVVYKVGVTPIPGDGEGNGKIGEFGRGVHRISGFLFSYHGSVAEELLMVNESLNTVDLEVRYRANGEHRKRTFSKVIFVGDATVPFASLNIGVAGLIGVPFRVQLPKNKDIDDRITDAIDS